MTKSGFISLTGRPNVGKSTLMNYILGEKIAITSRKPQTTRSRIQGIYTKGEHQMIFIDAPGIHQPTHRLGEQMVEAAKSAIRDVDVVLFVVEAGPLREEDRAVALNLPKDGRPVILCLNKTDRLTKDQVITSIAAYQSLFDFAQIVPVSAKTGDNVDELLKVIGEYLEEGPFFFPEDALTDQPERAIAAELIREKALKLLDKEIPHGIAVVIESFSQREEKELVDIDATIICEKASHKPIILGKKGAMIKKIGSYAREDMENLLGLRVNLQLFVKVKERWRDSDYLVRNFALDGAPLPEAEE